MQKYTFLRILDGWCNNLTALAFRAMMQTMLAHCGQTSSYNRNCTVELEEVSPDRVESLLAAVTRDMGADDEERERIHQDEDYCHGKGSGNQSSNGDTNQIIHQIVTPIIKSKSLKRGVAKVNIQIDKTRNGFSVIM